MKSIKQILENDGYLEEGIVYEAGLSRVLQKTSTPFAILTAFRDNFDIKGNRQRNRSLELVMKQHKMGGIKLIGHWQEAPDGMSYKEAKAAGKTKDVTEESFFIPMPDAMKYKDFEYIIQSLTNGFNQDAAIIGDGKNVYVMYKSGQKDKIGTKATFQKIDQAYSQLRGKPKIPFVFEGSIQPSNNTHRMAMKKRGLIWFSEA